MCRFKHLFKRLKTYIPQFKYIICVGSRKVLCVCEVVQNRLNTSYVSVQDILNAKEIEDAAGLNTSYVSVQAPNRQRRNAFK